ncbi:adenosylmethionine decarboxylase [Cladochytrium replicatum]|nr:adenosylmethionine decarboxylase [Cladochytrium replicatum]
MSPPDALFLNGAGIYASSTEPPENGVITSSGFEGPEKLLEVWFKVPAGIDKNDDKHPGLRSVPKPVWDEMLDIVRCKVLSIIENEHSTAYLLSESSMFVYKHRLVLKTCGTTTLLHAIPKLLEIASTLCGLTDIDALFYTRKALMFPEKQAWPHGKWGDEVVYLDKVFKPAGYETGGYVIGKINDEHWCLYMATPGTQADESDGAENDDDDDEDDDVTLEVLMTKMNPDVLKTFWKVDGDKAKEELGERAGSAEARVFDATGISRLYPTSLVDDYVFDPCGYSLNGLVGRYYYTIHVTPEDAFSYASVETSVPVRRYYSHVLKPNTSSDADGNNSEVSSEAHYEVFEDVVAQTVKVFQPEKFVVTLFTRRKIAMMHGRDGRGLLDGDVPGYRRRDRIVHTLGKWDLVFCHYEVPAKKELRNLASLAIGNGDS